MKRPVPAADRRYLPYLLFWPVIGLRYLLLERVLIRAQYYEVSCTLDALIPFQAAFLIPYVLWYFLIIGTHIYTFLCDTPSFVRYSRFLIMAFTVSTLTFLLYPSCQNLRPEVLPRGGFLTEGIRLLYAADTNTNVCPSEHVIGSVAVMAAVLHTDSLKKTVIAAGFGAAAFLSGIATVFLKQHSLVDVLAALPVCLLCYCICYGKKTTP